MLFNVDNVIFAPEKPSEATRLSWNRIGRVANCAKEQPRDNSPEAKEEREQAPITTSQEQQEKRNFITIPNIRDPKVDRVRYKEPRIVPEVKKIAPPGPDRIKIDKFVPSRKFDRSAAFKKQDKIGSEPRSSPDSSLSRSKIGVPREQERISSEGRRESLPNDRTVRLEDKTELEIEIEELKDRLPCIAVDEKDLILKSEGKALRTYFEIFELIACIINLLKLYLSQAQANTFLLTFIL